MTPASGRTAVVVEDDEGIRALICDVLEQAGLRTLPAANGWDGVAAARSHDPLVVTVDLRMPGIDGFETIRRIRVFSTALIVVLSARDNDEDEFESRRAGADLYMRKPFRPRELRAHVESHLQQEQHRA